MVQLLSAATIFRAVLISDLRIAVLAVTGAGLVTVGPVLDPRAFSTSVKAGGAETVEVFSLEDGEDGGSLIDALAGDAAGAGAGAGVAPGAL